MALLTALQPIGKGLAFAIVGFLIGAGAATGLTTITDRPATQPVITLGYVLALIGWLMGVGLWDYWAREWFGLPVKKTESHSWTRYFRFNTDHKVIGVQYLVTFVVLFLLAGLLATLMRVELMAPGQTIMGAKDFNTTMGLHGIIMIAVAVATFIGGFANFTIPLLIGAEDVAFPRINALSYWVVPPVAVLLILTPFFGGFDAGWTAYPPLSVINATGGLLFVLAFLTFGVSSILGGLNFLATIIMLRAPGMTWGRLPIFAWSIFAAALISLTATQFVAYGLLMIVLDRVVGTAFFDAARGGDPLLYEHIFWFYSHPAVYIMILPSLPVATGPVISTALTGASVLSLKFAADVIARPEERGPWQSGVEVAPFGDDTARTSLPSPDCHVPQIATSSRRVGTRNDTSRAFFWATTLGDTDMMVAAVGTRSISA